MVKPKLKRDWIGLIVKSRFPLRNGLGELPAGTLYKVTGNYAGLRLKSVACEKCGLAMFISKVHENDVVITEAGGGS